MRFLATVLAAALLVQLPACREQSTQPEDYFPPHRDQGGWRTNTSKEFVESLGLSHDGLYQLGLYSLSFPNSAMPGHDDHSHAAVLVVKNGWIVAEWYWRPEGRAFQQYLSSNGKSFAYALFGILKQEAAQGLLPTRDLSEQSRLYDPRWMQEGYPLSDPRKAEITFEQVFQHTSGLMPETTADGKHVETGRYLWTDYKDWVVGHDAAWPGAGQLFFAPGQPEQWPDSEVWGQRRFAYSSISFAHLGIAFRHISGQNADRLLWQKLLEPIGFDGVSYHHSIGDGPYRWFTAGGLRMTARDYARFCWLLLKKGRWGGRQLVPEEWIERAFASQNYPNLRSNVDGWLGGDLPADTLRIFGSGGNFAYIIPSHELIALHCGRSSVFYSKKLEEGFVRRLVLAMQPAKKEEKGAEGK